MQIIKVRKSFQRGFSMLETMAILAIGGIATIAAMKKLGADAVAKTADNAVVSAINIQNAARMYRIEHGTWPTSTAQLISGGFLTSDQSISPFNTSYTLTPTGHQLVVSNTAIDPRYAKRVSGLLPGGSVSGSTYSFRFLPPGTEASVQSVYSLDGSKPLTGSMNASGFDINSVGNLNANIISGSTVNGNTVNSNQINTVAMNATGRVTAGEVYSAGVVSGGSILTNGQIRGGSLVISGAASTGDLSINGNISATGHMNAGGNIKAVGSVTGSHLQSTGTLDVDGDANVDGTLRVGGLMYAPSGISTPNITDPANPLYSIKPAGASQIKDLSLTGDFNITKTQTIGTSCTSGGVAFTATNDLIVCKSGLWSLASEGGKLEYVGATDVSYNFGNLIIKAGLTSTRSGEHQTYYTTPFPAVGYFFTCSVDYHTNNDHSAALGCSANHNSVYIRNNSGGTKNINWIAIGFRL